MKYEGGNMLPVLMSLFINDEKADREEGQMW